MGVFTISEQMDVRREYRNYTYNILYDSMEQVKRIMEDFDEQQDVIRELNLKLTRQLRFSEEFQIYALGKVSQNGRYIAKSGAYLENEGLNNNLKKIPGGKKYIDLEACFSAEELEEFIKLCITRERDENKTDIIDVEGYTQGQEVIPETLKYYTIDKRSDEDGWYDEDAVLEKEYHFNVQGKEDLVPYKGDFWRLSTPIDFRASMKYQMTQHEQEVQKKLEAQILEWDCSQGWDWEKKLGYEAYSTYQSIETSKGSQGLGFAITYNPWKVAIDRLALVYLLSALVMGIMTFILTHGMWDTYKKQQLLEKNRRMLIDGIAHELKTPLGIIQAYSEGLKEKIAEHKKEHYLDVVIDETSKMNTLILEMLALSKLESKAYILKQETFSMQVLIENILKNRMKVIEDKKITLSIQIEYSWEITADYKGIEKVISNILSNAIEHTEEGKRIFISIIDGKVFIENEGLHIPTEKLAFIWDAFYKLEEINNRSGGRSGLGLSIVRNMLELHQMPFGVINTDLGVKFWFDISAQLTGVRADRTNKRTIRQK